MKKIFFALVAFIVGCSSEESTAPVPISGNNLIIDFSGSSIDVHSVDSAYALLSKDNISLKRYFTKAENSLVVPLNDLAGTWESSLFIYTENAPNDYPRQYTKDKAFIINGQPIIQSAPNGSIIDTWYPRILVNGGDVRFLVGLAPEDALVQVYVNEQDKWDYFSISKSALYENGNSVLVGSTSFEVFEPIQPPGLLNNTDLDLVPQIGDKEWNEIEIYGTLLDADGETEERPFYYRIAL